MSVLVFVELKNKLSKAAKVLWKPLHTERN